MARYFIEVAYNGKRYAGFQIQQNANTIQAEVENALQVYYRESIALTGSSRTDTGVHAAQNFFHFDYLIDQAQALNDSVYHLNAILPSDIVVKRIYGVKDEAHCRFDAKSREYEYKIYASKNPFIVDYAYYYPYPLDIELLNQAAAIIQSTEDFQSFSKKNTQVYTYKCKIEMSCWSREGDLLVYNVKGSRFLRGMVRGLVGTMLKVGTKKIDLNGFISIINAHDSSKVDFSTPPQALTLKKVNY